MARFIAVPTNVMCGDHECWWQVRDTHRQQNLLGYYYQSGAEQMAGYLNDENDEVAPPMDALTDLGEPLFR